MDAGQGGASNVRRVRARARGRVQGVSYRAATRAEALRLGLTGWVKNQADGSVLLEAQGDPDSVEVLLAWCAKGPPFAVVTAVETEDVPLGDDVGGFSVRS